MKAVPILAITNAIALAAVLLLYMQQSDLESQLKSARSGGRATSSSVDEAGLEARLLARLRGQIPGAALSAPTETRDEARVTGDKSDEPLASDAAPRGEGPPVLEGRPMESFRANVRRAQDLNREEDRVSQVVETLDRLISENKIGTLNAAQRKAVARTILGARDKIPTIWRKFRSDPELRALPREERGTIMREEMTEIRTEAQKELENTVNAADATTIMEEAMRSSRGMFGRGDRGTTRVRGSDGGNRAR